MRYRNIKTGIEFTTSGRIYSPDIIEVKPAPVKTQVPEALKPKAEKPKTEEIMPKPVEPEKTEKQPKKVSKPVKRSKK